MTGLTTEEKAKMMALPLIDLDENDHNDTDSVMKGIKGVFAALNLPLTDEFTDGTEYTLGFSHRDGNLVHPVTAIYNSEQRFIVMTIDFHVVPKSKKKKVAELINLLNIRFANSCTVMVPSRNVAVKSVMALSSWFNTQELFINLKELLSNGVVYAGTGAKLILTNETPAMVMERLDKYMEVHQAAE